MTKEDLRRLATIAALDRAAFFRRHPRWRRLYAGRVICVALCQGAAAHFVDGRHGIHDFDVYTFYAVHPDRDWYAKRIGRQDFGDPRFGQSPDKPQFIGRRVDCCGRSIRADADEDPRVAIPRYLAKGETKTARLLADRPVVLLTPGNLLGYVVWPASD